MEEQQLTVPALVHIIGGLIALGYAQNYYFHLRKLDWKGGGDATQVTHTV